MSPTAAERAVSNRAWAKRTRRAYTVARAAHVGAVSGLGYALASVEQDRAKPVHRYTYANECEHRRWLLRLEGHVLETEGKRYVALSDWLYARWAWRSASGYVHPGKRRRRAKRQTKEQG